MREMSIRSLLVRYCIIQAMQCFSVEGKFASEMMG